jgi:hypothetical protein
MVLTRPKEGRYNRYISIIRTVYQARAVGKVSSWMTAVMERIEGHYEVRIE